MSEYEIARIEQHESRLQTAERELDKVEQTLANIKFLVICIICEVPIVGVVI